MIKETSSVNETKYWLHKFDKDLLRQLDNSKILAAEKKLSTAIKELDANDKIILFSTLEIDHRPSICFIAYTMVEETIENRKKLYNKYESPKKLKLKGMKYFTDPVIAKDIYDKLNFIKNPNNPAESLKSEYKEITEVDFKTILRQTNFTKEFPPYFENLSFTMDEFILNSINSLFYVLKKSDTKKQIEIKTFIHLLTNCLKMYGISKNYDEVKEFYSKNAWKQGFTHKASRDPDKLVDLYNSTGKKRGFSYITLE